MIEWQDYVDALNNVETEIESLQEKIMVLRVRAEGTTRSLNGMKVQTSGFPDKVGWYGAYIADAQAELETLITKRKRIQSKILNLFSGLAERERAVMIRSILQKQTMKEISDALGLSRQSVYRIHNRAVSKLNSKEVNKYEQEH